MIPLRDDVVSRTVPFVTYALLFLNVLAFTLELGMGAELQRFLYQAAVVPVLFTGRNHVLDVPELITGTLVPDLGLRVLFSMFLHGGWMHVIGNMLFLWIFGDNVEDHLGHVNYLVFYLACGWIATFAHVWATPASRIPAIGASGAIAGVLGAYLVLYPKATVLTLLPLGFFTQIIHVPALFFLLFWFVEQFLVGAMSLGARGAQTGGVAVWAHIGGFVAGAAIGVLARGIRPPARSRPVAWADGRRLRARSW